MLSSLTIQNIALIDNLTIDLSEGLNCLTGETGAGKSLIIDSLSLLLGERADKGLISYGKDYAFVEAVFNTQNESVIKSLEDFGLEKENTIIISRKIQTNGKNECRVNGKMFTLSMLKKITTPLMDLHGQFEHQTLLSPVNHIKVLDNYNKDAITNYLIDFKNIFNQLKDVNRRLSGFETNVSERARLIDLYKFQIDEIESANFKHGEEEELKEFRVRVLSQEKILSSIKNALELAEGGGYGGSSIGSLLGRLSSEISSISNYLSELKEVSERLDGVKFEILDIIDNLESIKDNLYFNEFEAEENEKRLDLLSSLKKKYGNSIDEINDYLYKVKIEYKELINSEEIVEELQKVKIDLENKLLIAGKELSKARKEIAIQFEKNMIDELISLGMKDARFKVDFKSLDIDYATENGLDSVEFLFCANAGQVLMPLSKVASGGEMSRLMLSIKNITGNGFGVETMVFDEIDTGVSGHIAGVLAEKLSSIAIGRQVICVTHLAQIASYGHAHFFIQKNTINDKAITSVKELNEYERIEEVARLIGGKLSEHSLTHAKEMIAEGKEFKEKLL